MLYALHMSKASDSLHPSLLVNKLRACGFSEGPLILIRSYSAHQQNRTKLDTVASSQKQSVRGCLQESPFGPLLQNIFHNDLIYILNNASLSMYTDNHQLYTRGNSVEHVEQSLTNEGEKQYLNCMVTIFLREINYDKCNVPVN